MAATKAVGANALAGVTTTQSTTATDTSADYANSWFVKAVVGSSPAAAATFYVQESADGSTYYNGNTYSCGIVNGTYYWKIPLDPTCKSTILTFTAGTAGDCTFTAQLGTLTGM